jgi:hypothetical protein
MPAWATAERERSTLRGTLPRARLRRCPAWRQVVCAPSTDFAAHRRRCAMLGAAAPTFVSPSSFVRDALAQHQCAGHPRRAPGDARHPGSSDGGQRCPAVCRAHTALLHACIASSSTPPSCPPGACSGTTHGQHRSIRPGCPTGRARHSRALRRGGMLLGRRAATRAGDDHRRDRRDVNAPVLQLHDAAVHALRPGPLTAQTEEPE